MAENMLMNNQLNYVIKKYKISWDNIWNWDKKGFVMGLKCILKYIITAKDLYTAYFKNAHQDGNREWILCLACINVTGKVITPILIY